MFLNDKTIAISLLDVSNVEIFLTNLKSKLEINKIKNVVIHIDIMDRKFVDNKGLDLESIKIAKRYGFFTDVHLMVEDPIEYIDECIKYGADNITIHYEINRLYRSLKYLDKMKKQLYNEDRKLTSGIAINPKTDIKNILNYEQFYDVILLMSVAPGQGGQEYIEEVNDKISTAKFTYKMVQIDGGINEDTIVNPFKLGVDSYVIGRYITKSNNFFDRIKKIQKLIGK